MRVKRGTGLFVFPCISPHTVVSFHRVTVHGNIPVQCNTAPMLAICDASVVNKTVTVITMNKDMDHTDKERQDGVECFICVGTRH